MGTFDDLGIGERFTSPERALDAHTVRALIGIGGYTHPLFTDEEFAARSPFGKTPVPGPGLLLLMGGLAEQSERFDDTTIALVGFDEVRFIAPAFQDTSVRLEIEVIAKEKPRGDRGVLTMRWRCVEDDGTPLVEATAHMLFKVLT